MELLTPDGLFKSKRMRPSSVGRREHIPLPASGVLCATRWHLVLLAPTLVLLVASPSGVASGFAGGVASGGACGNAVGADIAVASGVAVGVAVVVAVGVALAWPLALPVALPFALPESPLSSSESVLLQLSASSSAIAIIMITSWS